ncbi:MAG: histidine phosphatase family protein [Cellulosilyticaceae bacterium]
MELLVVRHGESEADIIGCIEGRADFPLTERGENQGKALAKWMKKHYEIDLILSSPLKRARRVAELIQEEVGAEVLYWDELMEFNNGLLAGMDRKEADEKYPLPDHEYPHSEYYEKESRIAFRMRAETVMSKLIHEYSDYKRIVIVSHGGTINMLFRSFMNLPMDAKVGIRFQDTSVNLWKLEGPIRYIEYINRVDHLKE